MRRLDSRWVLAVAAMLVVAACGQAQQASGSPGTSTASSTAPSTQPSSPATPKVLRTVIGEPSSIDPNIAADYSIYTITQMFEPLYRKFSDGTEKMLGAESIEIGADGHTLTVKLNPDYKWSDGQPVTAHDYEFSWKRMIDPTTGSNGSFFLDSVTNVTKFKSGEITDPAQIGIKAIDDLTLEVKTDTPAFQFRTIMSLPYLAPVPKHVVEKEGEGWIADATNISNGPYRLVTWKHDQEIVMERNPNYGGAPPDIDRIEMQIRSLGDFSCLNAYEANEVDFVTEQCIGPQDIARIQADPTLSAEFRLVEISGTQWMQFDNNNPRWQKQEIRQALSLGIDREKLAEALSYGTAKPANVLVPAGIVGHDPAHALTGGIDRAKQLLSDAGYPGGAGFPEFTITTYSKVEAELVQQMWLENLGITSQVQFLEGNAFGEWERSRDKEPYDISYTGWYTDYEDPINWYIECLANDFRQTHYKDPQFLDLVQKAAIELDLDKRKQMFEEADALMEQQAPTIPLYTPTLTWLQRPYVQNLVTTGTLGVYIMSEAKITQ